MSIDPKMGNGMGAHRFKSVVDVKCLAGIVVPLGFHGQGLHSNFKGPLSRKIQQTSSYTCPSASLVNRQKADFDAGSVGRWFQCQKAVRIVVRPGDATCPPPLAIERIFQPTTVNGLKFAVAKHWIQGKAAETTAFQREPLQSNGMVVANTNAVQVFGLVRQVFSAHHITLMPAKIRKPF